MTKYLSNFLTISFVSILNLILIYTFSYLSDKTNILSIIPAFLSIFCLVISLVSIYLLDKINIADFKQYWFNMFIKISIFSSVVSVVCILLNLYIHFSPPLSLTLN